MTSIPLHLIETFVVFGECQNLVKTAKRLNQTQPSASRQIEQFQKHFKKALFTTVGRQKRLNDYGNQIYNYYKDNILEMHELQKNISNMSFQNQSQRLKLAARSEILEKFISPLKFHNPIQLQASTGALIKDELENSKLDIAVLHENFTTYNYFRKKIFSSQRYLVIPKSWGKVDSAASWFERLADQPFASYYTNPALAYPHSIKKIPYDKFNTHFIADDWRLIADKVSQQTCWSILPDNSVPKDKVVSLSLADYFKEEHFYLYFQKSLVKNQDVQYLIAQLSEN